MKHIILLFLLTALFCTSCKKTYNVPEKAQPLNSEVNIYPDYTNIFIPYNISPLNFAVRHPGDAFIVTLRSQDGATLTTGCDKRGIIQFDINDWHQFLKQHKGQSIETVVYAKRNDKWGSYRPFSIHITEDEIDDYVSYRLIEPGYELYRQIGLYQRNITNFDVQTIYENEPSINENGHCINCHNYQNYNAQRMVFHVREHLAGTVVASDGKIEKVNPKTDSTLSNAVYPAWHPTQKCVVFSSNKTGQIFHIKDKQKIECIDNASDLIFYNIETHEISNIFKTPSTMETFPAWSPKGDRLYYCFADIGVNTDSASYKEVQIRTGKQYENIEYNIMSIPFDTVTHTFGQPELEVDCKSMGLSGTLPRISPDGQYLLFTMGDFGQFHIWHKSSDQYVKNLQTGQCYPLTAANSKNSESFHNWSSNGRWIIFTTRRDDGIFTRLYITYIDKEGKAHKAFMLPQENPLDNIKLFKSYNVPEITKNKMPYKPADFKKVIYKQPLNVKYISKQ